MPVCRRTFTLLKSKAGGSGRLSVPVRGWNPLWGCAGTCCCCCSAEVAAGQMLVLGVASAAAGAAGAADMFGLLGRWMLVRSAHSSSAPWLGMAAEQPPAAVPCCAVLQVIVHRTSARRRPRPAQRGWKTQPASRCAADAVGMCWQRWLPGCAGRRVGPGVPGCVPFCLACLHPAACCET
jgi:hypothetical protein